MSQKIALITGANSGMGKATATAFANMGMDVIMLCRSKERGETALREVLAESRGESFSDALQSGRHGRYQEVLQ